MVKFRTFFGFFPERTKFRTLVIELFLKQRLDYTFNP